MVVVVGACVVVTEVSRVPALCCGGWGKGIGAGGGEVVLCWNCMIYSNFRGC